MNQFQPSLGVEKARSIERDQHSVSRRFISPNALKVLSRLRECNFDAYLVGGCVRDIILGSKPKDFDIATNATPEEIRSVFKNARIIGRRFKIVHIRFGREIIEVTTFRGNHETITQIADSTPRKRIKELDSAHSSGGMILRDNVYGSIDEDALRRDFTVNALYYTLDNFRVLDFCDGLNDLESGIIRMIGDPEARYREDPVRMLRAVRFSAKLGFDIEPNTLEPISRLAVLLTSISTARLFDETIKLLTSGHAVRTFQLLRDTGIGSHLFEPTIRALSQCNEEPKELLDLALINTDKRLADQKSVTPAFLFAALLWPVLQCRLNNRSNRQDDDFQALQTISNEVIVEQLSYTAIPKRFTIATREIWDLQLRLVRRNKRSIEGAFAHPRFRAAYDFLLLREESGENLSGIGQWWTDFQEANPQTRSDMIKNAARQSPRPRRKSRKNSGKTS